MSERRLFIPVHDPMEQEWAEKFWPEEPELSGSAEMRCKCPRCGGDVLLKIWRIDVDSTYLMGKGYQLKENYKECEYCPDCGQHIDWSWDPGG